MDEKEAVVLKKRDAGLLELGLKNPFSGKDLKLKVDLKKCLQIMDTPNNELKNFFAKMSSKVKKKSPVALFYSVSTVLVFFFSPFWADGGVKVSV